MALKVDFPTFKKNARTVLINGFPVMMRGPHGIGKSLGAYQIAESLAWDEENQKIVDHAENPHLDCYPVVERRASQMSEGDLLGLPVIDEDENTTNFNPPNWYKEACDNPVLLLMDELDRAVQEVRQGFFEMTDSRKISGFKLHPGTLIVAAINGGEDASQYQVADLDPAEQDRWTIFDLAPSIPDWVNWGRVKNEDGTQQVVEPILQFITQDPVHLEIKEGEDFSPGKKYPSRRSWTRFSNVVEAENLIKPEMTPADFDALYILSDAFVGFNAAVTFTDYIRNYEFMLSPDDILVHGKWKKTVDWNINDHVALVDKMIASDHLGNKVKVTKKKLSNLARYLFVLPSELAVSLYTDFGTANPDHALKLHGMTVDGKEVKKYIMEMMGLMLEEEKNKKDKEE
jgi:hypothetical protein